ncbi:hypothetical protein Mapa_011294 [Marchantia paleacea]|nr:hypothetical protein Mapa_011294 [Marchantia paleacea]
MSPCAKCGREAVLLKCSRCKIVHYCDRECQKQDWGEHKARCRPPAAAADSAARGSVQLGERMVLREVETARDTTKAIPVPETFPVQLRDFEYGSSPDGVDENLLILLHGSGGTHKDFARFAQRLELPQTAYLALTGPIKLPEALIIGSLWFEIFDDDCNLLPPGDRRRAETLKSTQTLLEEMIQALCRHCGWQRSRVFLFGYADGGTTVLNHAVSSCGPTRLGGAISISGPILGQYLLEGDQNPWPACKKDCTPVLITYGTRADESDQNDIIRTKRLLYSCHRNPRAEVVGVDKRGEMVSKPDEVRVLHQFFAEHLSRRMLNVENSSTLYEVSKS